MDALVSLDKCGIASAKSAAENSLILKNAIKSLPSGGYVILPAGTFQISEPIDLPNKIGLLGSGAFTSLFSAAFTGSMIRMIGTSQAMRQGHRLEGFGLIGNNLATNGLAMEFCVYHNIIRNVQVRDMTGAGILMSADDSGLQGNWGNTVENVSVSGCERGIEMHTAANAVRILNSSIHSNRGVGIYAETSTCVNYTGLTIEKNGGYGLHILGGEVSHVSGCYFEGNTDADIYTERSIWNGVDGLTISGCYFNGLEKTTHVLNIGDGEVTVIGGQSNRHTGTTILLREGGKVNNYGFISTDVAGMA